MLKRRCLSLSPMHQPGFSLVELMVSIVIGLLVLAGVVQVVFTSKQTFLAQEDMSYIQENARYALDVIGKDIQGAGHWGCAGAFPKMAVVAKAVTTDTDAVALLSSEGITGYSVGTSSADPIFPASGNYTRWVSPKLKVDTGNHKSEALIVRLASGTPLTVLSNASETLTLLGANNLAAGSYLTVVSSDCSVAGVLNITTITDTAGTIGSVVNYSGDTNCSAAIKPATIDKSYDCTTTAASEDASRSYKAGSTALAFISRGYFIEESKVIPGQPALKRKVLTAAGVSEEEEVALGVEDMSLLYGVKSGDDILLLKAHELIASDWNQVVSVQVSLLFRSQSESLSQVDLRAKLENVYEDRYQRQVVTSTFKLRNRI